MSTTDQAVLSEIQQHVQEPPDNGVTWPSELWTAAEVLNYANQRQHRFLKESGLLYAQVPVSVAANTKQITLPQDWVTTVRVSWKPTAQPTQIREIPRGSTWEGDHSIPTWPTTSAARMQMFADHEAPDTLAMWLIPAPNVAGEIMLLYISLAAALDGLGEIFTVPDEFVPYVKWGVIADMLNKVGRAHDPERAQYAEMRFTEGVEAAKLLVKGWED